MATAELGDVTIAYEIEGEGAPLILVAGCGQPAIAWSLGLTPRLVEAGYQVLSFDNRGVEPSSAPPAPYSVDQMADDALALLDHVGWDQPVLWAGHSLGGWITETVVDRHPERVRAAALMGSANVPTSWEIALTTVERDLARDAGKLPALLDAVESLRYLPTHEIQTEEVVAGWLAVLEGVEPWANPGRLGQYEACLAWSTAGDRNAIWRKLTRPCLVLGFEYDTDSPPVAARKAAQTIAAASYVEIAGAGHIGIVTHAQQVADALIAWFAEV